jgi:hypothetical protein
MYCTSRLALTSVSGNYSGQGVKLTTHLRLLLRLGMRGAVPRIVHTPAVIQQRIIQHRDHFAFTLQADAIAEHDTGGLPSSHIVANSLITICPVIALKLC